MFELRNYQTQSIQECQQAFRDGHKEIILMSPTGSGKSVIIRKIIEMAKCDVLFVVHRNILIKQMKETLKGLNVEISTLQKIGRTQTKKYSLIIHDECHYSFNSKLRNNLNFKWYLGLSATPLDNSGSPLKCDKIISFLQMPQLIELGYAVPFKVLSISNVDTSKLRSSNGDFNNKDSYELMSKPQVKKNILDVYLRYCKPNNLKTVLYAVNIHHAEELHREFVNAGIECEVIHSKKKVDTIINDFKNNKFRVLINVSILTIGFDDGDIEALILAAPTKSKILAQQIYGRVSRLPIKSNKTHGLILDCANVITESCHPMETINMNATKESKGTKCKCGQLMKLVNRHTKVLNDYEFVIVSDYNCTCGETLRIENIKLINMSLCPECNNIFEPKSSLEMISSQKDVKFVTYCKHCNYERNFRTILLSDAELKEISLANAINSKEQTWKQVETILKAECKNAGYHWRWAIRCIEVLKNKKINPNTAIEKLKIIKKQNKKLANLMHI